MSQYQLLLSKKVTSFCPVFHLVMTQISTSPVPKKHIVMSHNSSQRNPKLTSPVPKKPRSVPKFVSLWPYNFSCPKKWTCSVPYFILLWPNIDFSCPKCHLVLSHNLSCYDSLSTYPVLKSHPVFPIICLIMTQYQLLLSQKSHNVVPSFI